MDAKGKLVVLWVDMGRVSKSAFMVIAGSLVSIAIVASGVTYAIVHARQQRLAHNPLPATITTGTSFAVYYPFPLPQGYTYQSASASVKSDILFYKVTNGLQTVLVSEQMKPTHNLMLDSIVGLSPFRTSLGTAYVGKAGSAPVAIIVTTETLINVSGEPSVPQDIVNSVVQNMRKVR